MKKAKKLMAVVLALMVALTMGIATMGVAFADVTPQSDRTTETDGSITVSGTVAGQTYTLFRIFKADMGQGDAITYNTDGAALADNAYFELNSNGFVVAKDGVEEDFAKDADARAWAESVGTQVGDPITAASDGAEVKWTGLEYGYYYVKSSLGAFIGINSANKDGVIKEKNDKPSVDKEITGVKDSAGTASGSVFNATETEEKTDPGKGVNEQAIAQEGDTVSYKLTVVIKPGASNYVIADSMTNLNIVASSFKVDGKTLTEDAALDVPKTASGTSVTDKATSFSITLNQDYLNTVEEDTTLVITYDAVLNKSAAVADEANPNTVKLTWGTNPEANKSEDSAKVWTAEVDVLKTAEKADGTPLKDAGFKLKKGNLFYKMGENGVEWVAESEADEFMTGENGHLATKFIGLANGTYTLVESTVPKGYNKLDDTQVVIADSNVELNNLSQTKPVVNNAGTELPETGGIGTTIFYILGALLVIGCGIVLIARRRLTAK